MKKIFLSAIAIILLGACTQDINDIQQTRQEGDITGSVSAFKFDGEGLTRTSLEYGPDEEGVLKLKFFWAKDDKVAVFGESGTQQVVLNMSDVKEGQKVAEAKFSITEDYQLAEGQTYVAYYPRINNMSQHADKVAFSYLNQVQDGNTSGSTAHLGKYDYMATKPVVPGANNVADFEFQHQCSPMLIELQNVPAGTYKSLALKAEEDVFTTEGTYNIFSGEITPVSLSSVMTLTYKENIVVGEKGTLYAWMMTAPVDLTGKTLKVVTTDASGNTVEYDVPEKYQKEHKAAYYYTIVVNESQGPEYVDLGLPTGTLWATVNVGAENPEDYGNHYGWGEIETKSEPYSDDNYKFYPEGKSSSCTKYYNDGKLSLDDEDDVATVTYGSEWRMATKAEWEELKANCTWDETEVNGKKVYVFTSKNNGKSMYIPKNGYNLATGGLHDQGDAGYYWCKDKQYDSNNSQAYRANPNSKTNINIGSGTRKYGMGVRAVKKEKTPPYVDLGLPSGTLWAKYNLGATDENGTNSTYVAWGETEQKSGKSDYCPKYYKWYAANSTTTPTWTPANSIKLTKYVTDSYSGTVDNKSVLEPEDDAVSVVYGSSWHTPTIEQWQELYAQCTWTLKSGKGWEISKNGKSIFLPYVSYSTGSGAIFYWSSSLAKSTKSNTTLNHSAYRVMITKSITTQNGAKSSLKTDYNTCFGGYSSRYQGYCIRPVKDTQK